MRYFDLIRLGITSIGLSLYIYRPGKTYPFTSRITWGFFTKILILLGLYRPDQSDRSARPVRPVDLIRCQIWLSTASIDAPSPRMDGWRDAGCLSQLTPLILVQPRKLHNHPHAICYGMETMMMLQSSNHLDMMHVFLKSLLFYLLVYRLSSLDKESIT